MLRLGIIGAGGIASLHTHNILSGKCPEVQLTAMADRKESRREWIRATVPNAAVFCEGSDLIASDTCDAVLIATPHYQHPTLAIEAFRHGKHVLCEKPAGVYTLQVRDMIAEADKHPELTFGMMFNQRTNCVYRKAKALIDSGALGEIKRMIWVVTDWYRTQSYYDAGAWRATWDGEGGGVLLNQCPHQLDLLQWLCGLPVRVRAACHEGKWHDIEVEDDVTAYVEYASGATGTFITTTGDVPGTNRFEITLEKGKLVSEGGKLLKWELEMSEPEWSRINQAPFGTPRNTFTEVETDGKSEQHAGVLNAFAGAILHGTPLVAGGEEGINGLTISNAMHLSAWLGREVELPLDEELYYQELMKRVAVSRRKTDAVSVLADTAGTYNA